MVPTDSNGKRSGFSTARTGTASRPAGMALAVLVPVVVPRAVADDRGIRAIAPDEASRTAAAVVVDGAKDLVHTAQLLPVDARGRIVGPGRAEEQAVAVLDRLEAVLE